MSAALSSSRQALLGGLDQAVSSGTNFIAIALAAKALSAEQFGVFAAVYLLATIIVSGAQAVIGQELVLAKGDDSQRLEWSRSAVSAGLGAGICVSCVLALGSFAFTDTRPALLALALVIPVLIAQDVARHAASLMGRNQVALASDCIWLVALVAVLNPWGGLGLQSGAACLLAWGVAGVIAGGMALFALGIARLRSPDRYLARTFVGYRFGIEWAALRASSQTLTLLLGALASLSVVGGVRGATALFGPLTVAILATFSFAPSVLNSFGARRQAKILIIIGVVLVAATAFFTLLLAVIPSSIGEMVLGPTWSSARDYLAPIGAQTAFTCVSTVSLLGLRLVEPRSTLRLRLVPAALMAPLFGMGFLLFGAIGAIWGIALTAGVQAAIASGAYARIVRAHSRDAGLVEF